MNILKNLSTEEYKEFRRLVITMVLATDMSHHFQQINTIKGKQNGQCLTNLIAAYSITRDLG